MIEEILSADGASTSLVIRKGERLLYRAEPIDSFDGVVVVTNDVRSRGSYEPIAVSPPVDAWQILPAVPYLTSYRLEVFGRTQGSVRVYLEARPKILREYTNRDGRGIFMITEGGIELGDDAGGMDIASDGTLTLKGTATTWDDLRFPAQAINPPGQVSDPGIEATTGMLLFDANGTEIVMGVAQMPHEWVEGSSIVPHVHWQKTTAAAGNVLWRFEYDNVVNPGEVSLLTYANVLNTSAPVAGTPDDDTANRNLISSFGHMAMTDKRISACILWKLSRIGGDVLDTYGADARLIEFDIHYEINGFGSNEEFEK